VQDKYLTRFYYMNDTKKIRMWQKNAPKTSVEYIESNVWLYFYSFPLGT
jgi:hypothetical protein